MIVLFRPPGDPFYRPYLTELRQIFDDMDGAYAEIAGQYGFQCRGCDDNCCRTRFHHHTLLEHLYLHSGLAALPTHLKNQVKVAAQRSTPQDSTRQLMCPANRGGRCLVYPFRPMICRLHGIPHTFRGPNGTVRSGPGCHQFVTISNGQVKNRLDRTSFYGRLALLEKRLREELGFNQRIRMTLAHMIVSIQSLEQRHG